MANDKRPLPRWMGVLLGMLLTLFVGTPADAFAPASSPLLSAAAVPPNLMMLVDNSGSMDSILMDSGYNSAVTYPTIYAVTRSCLLFLCGNYTTNGAISNGSADYVFVGNLSSTYCNSGQYSFYKSSTAVLCLTLPDPRGNGLTRYPIQYLAYLVQQANAGNTITVTNSTRMLTAISVATSLVTANRSLRIGLATFNAPANNDAGPGGRIAQAISDLSPVTASGTVSAVTQATADKNFSALTSAIAGLSATSNTPLAETYYEITRYMRGLAPYYNSTPSTYTSPIQWRCQRNFGVVVTDGLPTYDRTFPTNDPLGGKSLPNWDGNSANDGTNLNGDGEGDTLYLDDMAKFAYDIDMRPATTNSTDAAGKSWDAVDFPKQNMSTYAIGFTASNQMLLDTASYGHGKYYLATDSTSLTTALSSALSDITSKAGSGGGGAASSSTVTATTKYYQTSYDPADWRGAVKAYAIDSTGAVASTASWSTDTTMAVGTTAATFESYNTSTGAVIPMAYANYSTAQKAVLDANLPTTPSGIKGPALVSWSQGTNITGLKTRTVLLGDVINSPLTLASPTDKTASDLTTDSTYTTYLAKKATNMTASLVVNANDGYTNVINATTGARIYSYMPSTALAGLYKVADTAYINGTSHTFLNDGQIGVYDVQIGGVWKTVAFSGTGGGGKAYSAIQLYDSSAGNVVKALWEGRPDTSTAFANLGYAYSKPEVARLPDGTWAAFIANGYGSTKGVASLLVVSLETGTVIKEIVAESTNGSNGLSSVKLKVDASNYVQAAYGGDLLGHMWKFDLSNASTASWGVAFSGLPLFTAPGGSTQPITAQPLLVTNTTSGKMVYFGTGKLLETADKTTTSAQGFYAIWDADGGVGNYTTSNLQAQSIAGFTTVGTTQYITTSTTTTNYTSLKGWYLPLVSGTALTGQRVIYPATYSSGNVLFTTAGVDTTDPCSSQGSGYGVILDALSGRMLTTPALDTTGDGLITSADIAVSGFYVSTGIPNLTAIFSVSSTSTVSGGTVTSTTTKYVYSTSGGDTIVESGGTTTNSNANAGRIMWRQIQ